MDKELEKLALRGGQRHRLSHSPPNTGFTCGAVRASASTKRRLQACLGGAESAVRCNPLLSGPILLHASLVVICGQPRAAPAKCAVRMTAAAIPRRRFTATH